MDNGSFGIIVWSSWDSVWAINVRLSALVHALILHISILVLT